jgi:hypothetical protein
VLKFLEPHPPIQQSPVLVIFPEAFPSGYFADRTYEAAEQHPSRLLEWITISRESAAYRAMHADLIDDYLGQYVAIHDGKLVDHGSDFSTLHERVRKRFGRQPVLVRRVEINPERTLVFRSPCLDYETE